MATPIIIDDLIFSISKIVFIMKRNMLKFSIP
jgi:hypothetical protein